jgi:tetratricopeptide (TPR) repeat protein
MRKINLDALSHLLEKLIYDGRNPYYEIHEYSKYKDGIILLRTNFYEPLLNELYTREHHREYEIYFNANIKKSERHFPAQREMLRLYEKLIIVLNNGIRPAENEINHNEDICLIHNLYLNDAIHNNPNVTQYNYVQCYFVVQNFAKRILGQHNYSARLFNSEQEVTNYINTEIGKLKNDYFSAERFKTELDLKDNEIRSLNKTIASQKEILKTTKKKNSQSSLQSKRVTKDSLNSVSIKINPVERDKTKNITQSKPEKTFPSIVNININEIESDKLFVEELIQSTGNDKETLKFALSKEITNNPKNRYLFLERARINHFLKLYKEAESDLNKIEKIDISFYDMYEMRGIIRFEMGNYEQAIDDLTQFLYLSKKNALNVFYLRGLSKYKLKNWEHAILDFNKAIQLDSLFTSAYEYLVKCHSKLLNNIEALKNINTLIVLKPEHLDYHKSKAVIKDNLCDIKETIKEVELLLKKFPGEQLNYIKRVKMLSKLNRIGDVYYRSPEKESPFEKLIDKTKKYNFNEKFIESSIVKLRYLDRYEIQNVLGKPDHSWPGADTYIKSHLSFGFKDNIVTDVSIEVNDNTSSSHFFGININSSIDSCIELIGTPDYVVVSQDSDIYSWTTDKNRITVTEIRLSRKLKYIMIY